MAREISKSERWRYRTAALAGPWRSTVAWAATDAIAQGQAIQDESQPNGLRWRLPGWIEGDPDAAGSRSAEGPATTNERKE